MDLCKVDTSPAQRQVARRQFAVNITFGRCGLGIRHHSDCVPEVFPIILHQHGTPAGWVHAAQLTVTVLDRSHRSVVSGQFDACAIAFFGQQEPALAHGLPADRREYFLRLPPIGQAQAEHIRPCRALELLDVHRTGLGYAVPIVRQVSRSRGKEALVDRVSNVHVHHRQIEISLGLFAGTDQDVVESRNPIQQ